jgi:hypothetical protein
LPAQHFQLQGPWEIFYMFVETCIIQHIVWTTSVLWIAQVASRRT